MSEKTLYELRVTETDEGFRIEVKGDKEQLRRRGFGPPSGLRGAFGFNEGRHGGHRRCMHRHMRHGPGAHHHGPPPWMDWTGDQAPEGTQKPALDTV